MRTRVCRICLKRKRIKQFYEQRKDCIECHLARKRKYNKRMKKEIGHRNRKQNYGITTEEYTRYYEIQQGKCAICNKLETSKRPNGTICSLSVDHDHVTGKVRGLLCNKCNRGIGYLLENIKIIYEAIKYLWRTSPEKRVRF